MGFRIRGAVRAMTLGLATVALATAAVGLPSGPSATAAGGSITGKVTAMTGGEALAGITLDLLTANERTPVAQAVTGLDGTYLFADVAAGSYVLCAEQDNPTGSYLPYCWAEEELEGGSVLVVDSEPVDFIDFRLRTYASISGTIAWSDGSVTNPLPNAHVYLVPSDGQSIMFDSYETSGPDGAFVFPRVSPGEYVIGVEFAGDSPWLNFEYWEDAIIWADATTVTVEAEEELEVGSIVLDERTIFVGRMAGADRYATAVAISQARFPDPGVGVPVVYVASGVNYPDALAAGPAAIVRGGVLLTTNPTSLPAVVRQELVRLHPQRVVVVGGVNSVSDSVLAQISSAVGGGIVDRIGGATRYETARMIVDDAFDRANYIYLATGRNYPDALSAGPAAGVGGAAVVLIDGSASSLDQETIDLIVRQNPYQIYLVGGPQAISPSIEAQLRNLFLYPTGIDRFAGWDRYETSYLINQDAFYGHSDAAFTAVGTNFADALTGGVLAGAWKSPLYLTPSTCLMPVVPNFMVKHGSNLLVLLGGTAALSPAVEAGAPCSIAWYYN